VQTYKHEKWINVAKIVAMFAVLVDHTSGVLYHSMEIKIGSYYSVSLFILCMGVTTWWSYSNVDRGIYKKVLKHLWGVLVPYIVSVFVLYGVRFKQINIGDVFLHCIHFDAEPPHYYICLYLQLLLISPVVFYLLKHTLSHKRLGVFAYEILIGIIILMISAITTNFTNVYDVMGGGGKLLGGTYLFVFFIGMLIGKHSDHIMQIPKKLWQVLLVTICVSLIVVGWNRFICWDQFSVDMLFPFGEGGDVPSFSIFIYALSILLLIMAICRLCDFTHCKVFEIVIAVMDWLGNHTLFIFLYHFTIMDYLKLIPFSYIWVARIVFFALMIIIPIILEWLYKKVKKMVVMSYC